MICLLPYKVLLNLNIFLVLNKNCTESYLVGYIPGYIDDIHIYTRIKIIVQSFEFKSLKGFSSVGAISLYRRFSKASHRCEAKMCGLSLLTNLNFQVFTL